jgi:uncharacterized YccA/Bax inhibitor family protein
LAQQMISERAFSPEAVAQLGAGPGAAPNLFVDHAVIDNGIKNGAPTFTEWYAAWGLLATVIWLYLEVLYLLASIRSS